MNPVYDDHGVQVYHGDCLDVLRELPDGSVDAVVTDPPYGLEFMGKDWDRFADAPPARRSGWKHADSGASLTHTDFKNLGTLPAYGGRWTSECIGCGRRDAFAGPNCRCDGPPQWRKIRTDDGATFRAYQSWCQQWATECLRVAKPGAHLLAFGGTRTWHRLCCAIEDAGWEIRDSIQWVYSSGFPKSLDVSKAIDAREGYRRGEAGAVVSSNGSMSGPNYARTNKGAPVTDDARRWQGWGTATKPAHEPIVVARKPLAGTVAQNVLVYGTGGLNIDGCRTNGREQQQQQQEGVYNAGRGSTPIISGDNRSAVYPVTLGRWPPNLLLTHAESCQPDRCDDGCPVAEMDRQSGESISRRASMSEPIGHAFAGETYGPDKGRGKVTEGGFNDSGGGSRFFPTFRYTPKADTAERVRGDVLHPTVKPLELVRWLVRLVTPPDGVVLDCFAGSGTTGEAALLEGFQAVLIEREADYLPLIKQRITRRRDPVQHLRDTGGDLGLFEVGP